MSVTQGCTDLYLAVYATGEDVMDCPGLNDRRRVGAESIVRRTWEIAAAVGVDVSWVGIDYGLPIESRSYHTLGVVAGGRSIQLTLDDCFLIHVDGAEMSKLNKKINSCLSVQNQQ